MSNEKYINAAWGMFESYDPLTQRVIITLLDAERVKTEQRIIKILEANTMRMTNPMDNTVIEGLRITPSEFIALIGEDKIILTAKDYDQLSEALGDH